MEQKINFSHVTPDGVTHDFLAPAYHRGLDTETPHLVFTDGHAPCSCPHKEHLIHEGIIKIPYSVSGKMSGETIQEIEEIHVEKRYHAQAVYF